MDRLTIATLDVLTSTYPWQILQELKKASQATLENQRDKLHDVRVEIREIEAANPGIQVGKKIERQVSTCKQQYYSLHLFSCMYRNWLLVAGTTKKMRFAV